MVGATYKVGQKAEYSIREVVQWWIAPKRERPRLFGPD